MTDKNTIKQLYEGLLSTRNDQDAANAIQTMLAERVDGEWQVALFHNTPAQFHGRPEAAAALSAELRQLIQ